MKHQIKYIVAVIAGLISANVFAQTSNPTPAPVVAGCTSERFVTGGELNEIKTVNATYTPRCLKVKVGATVSIQATSRHPLMAMADINNVVNPFAASQSAITTQTRKMTEPGIYGFYCEAHGNANGAGMAGVIVVEETNTPDPAQ